MDAYHPRAIQDHSIGMLANYRNRQLQDAKQDAPKGSGRKGKVTPLGPGFTTNLKTAGESVYLGLKVIFTANDKQVPPPFKIDELLTATDKMLDAEEKKWINELVEARMKDKTQAYVTTPEFCQFLDKCMDLEKQERGEKKEHLEKKVKGDRLFLSFFDM